MKLYIHRVIALSVLCCLAFRAYADGYKPLVEDGKVWHMRHHNVEASHLYPDYDYLYTI